MDDSGFSDFSGEDGFSRPAGGAPVTVGLVGSRGRMGAWLAGILEKEPGVELLRADRSQGNLGPEFARGCQVLVLSVPVYAVEEVMARLGPGTEPTGVVLDLGSLKEKPLAAMLAHARGEVLGAHPLCGPSAPGLAGQTVFLCPGRGEVWPGRLAAWLTRAGARVAWLPAREHDRLMARVQTLRHFLLAAWGGALAGLGADPAEDPALAGPWNALLRQILDKQCSQPAELFADLALNNPHAQEVAERLAAGAAELARALAGGDRERLLSALSPAWDWLGSGPESSS
ncbi:MAG: prephenate dehydrogenase/arogenate dehydrogenase family protein [Deltaproteobacteria bacterium]|nr:prephenate dehydrogenase/arogenate dehydrogenase family protein [Deltaproteobacteria bacterium]